MPSIRLYSPVPQKTGNAFTLSARHEDVAGLKFGFIGNRKPNADVLLNAVAEILTAHGAAHTFFREKENYSLPAATELLDELAATCQGAFVAIAD